MAFPDDWLHIKNWEKFQYRSDKRLPWIRLDCALLQDREFLKFDRATQRDLIAIWLLARNQSHAGWIPNDSKVVSKLIQGSRILDLMVFIKTGWLQAPFCYQVDTNLLPSGYQVATTLLPLGNNLVLDVPELQRFIDKKCALQDRTGHNRTEHPPTPLRGKAPKKPEPLFVLPDWIPHDKWDFFIEMRKRKRNNPTDHAKDLLVKKLMALKSSGQEPGMVLDQSTERGWLGLFEISGNGNGQGTPRKTFDQLREERQLQLLNETAEKMKKEGTYRYDAD